MKTSEALENPVLRKMVQGLAGALGDILHGVVLYGSAARGDFQKKTSDFNLIVVLEKVDPASLEKLAPALQSWRRQGQPLPRIFSPAVIAESADVFPIEFLDIRSRRVVLHGKDPFADVEIHLDHLRLQCERELREKMMRLREGYVEAHGKPRDLRRLLTDSYTTFVALFRGCLHLLGEEVPVHNNEVVAAFCARADLDRSPFDEVDRLKHGEKIEADPKPLFQRYYDELTKAVHRINRFESKPGGKTS
jgi:predicted nucleotidyltransferase